MTKLAFLDGDDTLWWNERREQIAESIAAHLGLHKGDPGWTSAFYEAFLAPTLIPYDEPFPQTRVVLHDLGQQGYTRVLLTANLASTQAMRKRWLTYHDLADSFDGGLIFKPDERRYEKTIEWKAGALAEKMVSFIATIEEVLVVDDDIRLHTFLPPVWQMQQTFSCIPLHIFPTLKEAQVFLLHQQHTPEEH